MSDRRITNHSGRAHKSSGRVYNVDHNDRQFEHENNDLESRNVYWQCLQTDEIVTFKQCEREMYQHLYGEHLRKCNENAEKNRHADRIKTIDDYLKSAAMAPEETLYYLGDKDNQVPTELLNEFAKDMVQYIETTFPQIKVLDYAIHRDEEGADHIHMRKTYMAYDKNGDLAPQQNKALEQMGIERPDKNQPRSRYNNNKQTFTAMERVYMKEWCLQHNIELTTEPPREPGKQGRDMQMFQFSQELEQTTNALNMSRDALQQNENDAIEIQQRIEQKHEELARIEHQIEREQQKRERMGKTWLGKKKDRIEVDRSEFERVLEYCKQSTAIDEQQQMQQQSLDDKARKIAEEQARLDAQQAQIDADRRCLDLLIYQKAKGITADYKKQIKALREREAQNIDLINDYEQTNKFIVLNCKEKPYIDSLDNEHEIRIQYTIGDLREIAAGRLQKEDFIREQRQSKIQAIEDKIEHDRMLNHRRDWDLEI